MARRIGYYLPFVLFNVGNFNDSVFMMRLQPDGKLLVGGTFTTYTTAQGTFTTNRIVRLLPSGDIDQTFEYGVGKGLTALPDRTTGTGTIGGDIICRDTFTLDDGRILLIGRFGTYNNTTTPRHLVMLNGDGTIDTTTTFNTNLGVALDVGGDNGGGGGFETGQFIRYDDNIDRFIIGGNFTEFNGVTAYSMVMLNGDGTHNTSFVSEFADNIGGRDISLDITSQEMLVVGDFNSYGVNSNTNKIVKIDYTGSVVAGFTGSFSGGYDGGTDGGFGVKFYDGHYYVAGDFDSYNGTLSRRFVKINAATGAIENTIFNIGDGVQSGTVRARAILIHNEKIYVGGTFTEFNGVPANRIYSLNMDGSENTDFDYGTGFAGGTTSVNIIDEYDNYFVFGGNFTTYQGQSSENLAKISISGEPLF